MVCIFPVFRLNTENNIPDKTPDSDKFDVVD